MLVVNFGWSEEQQATAVLFMLGFDALEMMIDGERIRVLEEKLGIPGATFVLHYAGEDKASYKASIEDVFDDVTAENTIKSMQLEDIGGQYLAEMKLTHGSGVVYAVGLTDEGIDRMTDGLVFTFKTEGSDDLGPLLVETVVKRDIQEMLETMQEICPEKMLPGSIGEMSSSHKPND